MGKPSLGERVKERRKELGLSQTDLAKLVGMRQQGIQSIEEGKSQRPRKLRELAAALDTTEEWLLGEPPREIPAELFQLREIPVIGEVAAGLWMEVTGAPEEPLETMPFMPALGTKVSYALRVRGNSMDRTAPDGSYLMCAALTDTGLGIEDGDLVIVERLQAQRSLHEVTVKRVRRKNDGLVLLPESTDPRWKPVEIHSGNTSSDDLEVRVLAHVVWVAQRGPKTV